MYLVPVVIALREYQNEQIVALRNGFRAGANRQLLVMATGGGKTVIFCFMTKTAMEKGLRVMILAHRSEILDQIDETLAKFGIEAGHIRAGRRMDKTKKVFVASVQTLVNRLDEVPAPDLVIVDECFPAGTMIDGRPIELICVGSKIRTHLGFGIVQHRFVKKTSSICKVTLTNGRTIVCTPNHPIWTQFGFKPASSLTPECVVLSITPNENVCDLRKHGKKQALRKQIVQVRTVSKDNPKFVQEARRRDNEVPNNKRNAQARSSCGCLDEAESNEMEADCSTWKRSSCADSSAGIGGGAGMEMRSGCGDWCRADGVLSDMLQGGCWKQRPENCRGSGRELSLRHIPKSSGCKEGGIFDFERVASVEVFQQGSGNEFESLCPEGVVYNFEVSNGNTYFAEGILVHNCHHAAAGQYVKVFAHYSKSKFVGVTATPERLDGKGLGDFFDSMVLGPQAGWLINNGFLKRPIYLGPSAPVDVSAIKKVAGDYSKSELAEAMGKKAITGDAVDHYRRFGCGAPAVTFCVNLKHAAVVAEQFNSAGIRTEIIDGSMDPADRRSMKARLASGETRNMVSCELVSEGFDLPAVGCAILLRPTASLSLHLQQVGRALRPHKGQDRAIILDHAGNCLRHGPAEEDREWSLEGNASKKRKKEVAIETRQCVKCYAIFQGTQCAQCGTTRESKAREIEVQEGQLREMEAAELMQRRQKRAEEGKCRSYEEFLSIAKARGYNHKWAFIRWKSSRHYKPQAA